MISSVTIAELRQKCKTCVGKIPRDALVITVLILASSASFGLGYLAGLDAGQTGQGSTIEIENIQSSPEATAGAEGQFVASKNGTKYYPVSCAGASKISDANKVYFTSASLAERAGYTLAANCNNP